MSVVAPELVTQRAMRATPWHILKPEKVLQDLQTSRAGLSAAEAGRRLESHGRND